MLEEQELEQEVGGGLAGAGADPCFDFPMQVCPQKEKEKLQKLEVSSLSVVGSLLSCFHGLPHLEDLITL